MKTEIIALYLGATAAFIPMAVALFFFFKSVVDKECPYDNCEHCGCVTHKGVCPGRCQPDSTLKIDHTTPDLRPDFNEWMAAYNHSLTRYFI